MVHLPRSLMHSFKQRIFQRVSALQTASRAKGGIALGIFLVLFSSYLGNWAQKGAFLEAIRQWEKLHPPHERTIGLSLGTRGWRQLQDPRLIQWVVRQLPVHTDEAHTFWITSERN